METGGIPVSFILSYGRHKACHYCHTTKLDLTNEKKTVNPYQKT